MKLFFITFLLLIQVSIQSSSSPVVDTSPTDVCTIDFDTVNGNMLSAGDIITNQYSGITFQSLSPDHPLMIFDSSNPSGGDFDLGTPNEAFDGPGVGTGGAKTNSIELYNILILSEDGNSANPNDSTNGGIIQVTFDSPVQLHYIEVIDNEADIATIVGKLSGLTITDRILEDKGDNGYQKIAYTDATIIDELTVSFTDSAGLASISTTCVPSPSPEPTSPLCDPDNFFTKPFPGDVAYMYFWYLITWDPECEEGIGRLSWMTEDMERTVEYLSRNVDLSTGEVRIAPARTGTLTKYILKMECETSGNVYISPSFRIAIKGLQQT